MADERGAGTKLEKGTAARTCPICGKPTHEGFRPFCSRRCSDVDLARWLTGSYAIAGGGADADEDGDETRELPSNGGAAHERRDD